jgi:stage V sporulation protein B
MPSSTDKPASPEAKKQDAQKAGRGGLAIAGAKVYFILAGLIQQIALNHILGTQGYGALSRVQSLASMVYNPIVSTAVQGVSRSVASSSEAERPFAQRRALRIHSLAILPVALGFFFAAPWLTSLIKAPHLLPAVRLISGVLLLYGIYTPLVGVLNGQKRFGAQAAIDAIFATIRTFGLLLGAYLFAKRGLGVEGAIGGFVVAAGLILAVALPLAGIGKKGSGGVSTRQHLAFALPLLGGQVALNLLLQADLQLLGRFAADAAQQAGKSADAADVLTGAYRAAQLFGFLPYQLLLSITFVLFPLLASSARDGDREATARYVRTGIRLALILAGAMVSVTAGLSPALLRLIFRPDTAELAGEPMRILVLGLGAFAIFGIMVTVLTSLKREKLSAALTLAALALVVLLCSLFVRGQAYGPALLQRTAMATASGLFAAALLACIAVYRTVGTVAPWTTLLRVLLSLAAAVSLGLALPSPGKVMTLVYSALVAGCYLFVLILSRELGRDDWQTLRRIVGRAG